MQTPVAAEAGWTIADPRIISMTMTSRCNLRCVMCDHGIRNVKKEDFKADLVDMSGDFIASASLVDLTGLGEPMLSDLFWNILQKFPAPNSPVDSQFFLTFNTNGTLLNERNIERVLRSRTRKLRVSLDSADGELYGRIRGTDLAPIVAGLRDLVRRRDAMGRSYPKIGVEMTLMRENLQGVREMIDLCADTGVDFLEIWSLNHVAADSLAEWKVSKGGWTFDYAAQMLDTLEKPVLEAAIDEFYAHAGERRLKMVSLILGEGRRTDDFPPDAWQLDNRADPDLPWSTESIRCDLPWKELRVTYDGDVFACCWGPRPIGNLRTQTLEQIWNSIAIREMRADLLEGVVPKLCSGAACHQIGGKPRNATEWHADRSLGVVTELSAVPLVYEGSAGLYNLESYRGRKLRWTDGAAEIVVRPIAASGPTVLEIKLWNFENARSAVSVTVGGRQMLFADLAPDGLDASIPLGHVEAGTRLLIRIDSTQFAPTDDSRQLGVAIESLRLVCRPADLALQMTAPPEAAMTM